MNPSELEKLCKTHNLPPLKKLGQHFLWKEPVLEKIVTAADLQEVDNVLEIGPGLGGLTRHLVDQNINLTVVEKDERFISFLRSQFPAIRVMHDDALQYRPENDPYKIVANIPYYITSPLINHYLREQYMMGGNPPKQLVLLIQQEVAEKICAGPDNQSVLSLEVTTFGTPKIIAPVPKKYFYPVPKVDSAILRIDVFDKPAVSCNLKSYFRIIHHAFSQRRKKIANTLSAGLHMKAEEMREILKKLNIDPGARAQTLTVEQFETLTKTLL